MLGETCKLDWSCAWQILEVDSASTAGIVLQKRATLEVDSAEYSRSNNYNKQLKGETWLRNVRKRLPGVINTAHDKKIIFSSSSRQKGLFGTFPTHSLEKRKERTDAGLYVYQMDSLHTCMQQVQRMYAQQQKCRSLRVV